LKEDYREYAKERRLPEILRIFNSVKIISGYKALENISSELDLLGAKRPIIITDKGVNNAGLMDHVVNSFGGTQITIGAVYDDTPSILPMWPSMRLPEYTGSRNAIRLSLSAEVLLSIPPRA